MANNQLERIIAANMSVKSHKLLKNGAPLPGMGRSSIEDTARQQREEVDRIQQDIFVLSQRIAEAKGESIPNRDVSLTSSSGENSPFVSSLRALADVERRNREIKEQKVHALESLLDKVSEYSRLVLARTSPPEAQLSEAGETHQVRRKSLGSDLSTLPSHLRLIDRLFDLHTQSKRITVIRTSDSKPSSARSEPQPSIRASAEVEAEISQLKNQLSTLQIRCKHLEQQHVDITAKRDQLESQNNSLTNTNKQLQDNLNTVQNQQGQWEQERQRLEGENNAAKSKNDLLQLKCEQIQAECEKWSSSIGSVQREKEEIARMQRQLQEEFEQKFALQQQELIQQQRKAVELQNSNIGGSEALLGSLRKYVLLLQTTDAPLSSLCLNSEEQQRLTDQEKETMLQLQSGLHLRLQSLQKEVALLLAVKETLEGDLASAGLQRDLLQQDFVSLQEQHEALRAAYHSQSFELATRQSNNLNSNSNSDSSALKEKDEELKRIKIELETQSDTIRTLENSLQLQRLQLRTLEQWPQLVADLETKIESAAKDKMRLESQLHGANSELAETQKLAQSLRDRLRDACSGKSANADSGNWNDTFEEVMQEELHAMKVAFEAKLKAARDESEALSKRHQQEILRLQQVSHSQHASFSALPGLPPR